jgi:YesN/AraC family two-component response regulator
VITDLTMPQMTGIELAKKMLKTRPSLPIILTSGYSSQLTSEAVQELGIRELILKPLDHIALLGGIQRALDPAASGPRE